MFREVERESVTITVQWWGKKKKITLELIIFSFSLCQQVSGCAIATYCDKARMERNENNLGGFVAPLFRHYWPVGAD